MTKKKKNSRHKFRSTLFSHVASEELKLIECSLLQVFAVQVSKVKIKSSGNKFVTKLANSYAIEHGNLTISSRTLAFNVFLDSFVF